QPHVGTIEILIYFVTKTYHGCPLFFRVRLGHARIFVHAHDFILVFKTNAGNFSSSSDRSSALKMGSAAKRYVTFTSEQTRCRIQSYPTSTWNVYLSPRMQVG